MEVNHKDFDKKNIDNGPKVGDIMSSLDQLNEFEQKSEIFHPVTKSVEYVVDSNQAQIEIL